MTKPYDSPKREELMKAVQDVIDNRIPYEPPQDDEKDEEKGNFSLLLVLVIVVVAGWWILSR